MKINSNISAEVKTKQKKKLKKKNKFKEKSNNSIYSQNWKAFLETQKVENGHGKNRVKKSFRNNKNFLKKKNKQGDNANIYKSSENGDVKKPEKSIELETKNNLFSESVIKDGQHTKYIAMDCEMVGVGINAKENVLARVSLVNSKGECIYDTFVKPKEKVVDYRTNVSGIRAINLKNAPEYETVQKEVYDILKDKIIVGHALQNDLKVLMLSHSRRQIRDTQKYEPLQKVLKTKKPALRKLVAAVLNETIQSGEHSSIVDARATMRLFQKYKKEWEKSLHIRKISDDNSNKEIFIGKDIDKKKKKVNLWKKRKLKRKKE